MDKPKSIAAVLTLTGCGEPSLTATLDLTSNLDRDLADWDLQFDLPKPVAAVRDSTRLLYQVGSHIGLQPIAGGPLVPGIGVQLAFTAAANSLQRLTDLPAGLYVRSGGDIFPVSLDDHNLGAFLACAAGDNAASRRSQRNRAAVLPEAVTGANCPVIPRPQHIAGDGRLWQLPARLVCHATDDADVATAETWLALQLAPGITVTRGESAHSQLCFVVDDALATEAHELRIRAGDIELRASDSAGFFYAAVSLVQLLQVDGQQARLLPCLSIRDRPRLGYRGFMLDCARHFHDRDTILAILDHMARYKLNHFHWHLTDDEGWRLPVPALPELTARAAWRGEGEALAPQFGSGPQRYGGFYSREDIQEVVAYARHRHITVVPEIDIPGHSRAAIRALPELLTEPADRSVYRSVQLYDDNVLNPALPGTYRFLDAVLEEVCALFPGPLVHMGGDEVPAGVWEQSPACQAMLAEYGYRNTLDLQGHLLRHAQEFLRARGRRLLGWEEAANGEKLPRETIICAWSSSESAARVAAMGYRVINCPAPFAYLDLAWDDSMDEPGFYWAGTADLEACYTCEPAASELEPALSQRIIGVQAQLWSELVADRSRLEYMLFPRLLAWAEIGWTEPGNKHWPDFLHRVKRELGSLASREVNYHAL